MRLASETVGRTEVYWIDFSEEVARGLALLEKEMPDALDAVDVGALTMSDSHHCIVGQAVARVAFHGHGDFIGAVERLFPGGDRASTRCCIRHGFDLPMAFYDGIYGGRYAPYARVYGEVHGAQEPWRVDGVSAWAWECLGEQWADALRERRAKASG